MAQRNTTIDRGEAKHGSRRMLYLGVLLTALAVGSFEFLRHDQLLGHVLPKWISHGWSGSLASALLAAVIAFCLVRFFVVNLRRRSVEADRAREEAAVVIEYQRISGEMYDGIAQTLFCLNAKLYEVQELMAAGESERARGELRAAEEDLEDICRRVRTFVPNVKRLD